MRKVQWGEYKLKNQVLWIDVGCLTDSLDQSLDCLKSEPWFVQEDTYFLSSRMDPGGDPIHGIDSLGNRATA